LRLLSASPNEIHFVFGSAAEFTANCFGEGEMKVIGNHKLYIAFGFRAVVKYFTVGIPNFL